MDAVDAFVQLHVNCDVVKTRLLLDQFNRVLNEFSKLDRFSENLNRLCQFHKFTDHPVLCFYHHSCNIEIFSILFKAFFEKCGISL